MYLEKTVSYSLKINPDTQSQIWAKCSLLQFTHVCAYKRLVSFRTTHLFTFLHTQGKHRELLCQCKQLNDHFKFNKTLTIFA